MLKWDLRITLSVIIMWIRFIRQCARRLRWLCIRLCWLGCWEQRWRVVRWKWPCLWGFPAWKHLRQQQHLCKEEQGSSVSRSFRFHTHWTHQPNGWGLFTIRKRRLPMRTDGLTSRTISLSLFMGGTGLANWALWAVMPPSARFWIRRPLESTSQILLQASSCESPSFFMAITISMAIPNEAWSSNFGSIY